MQNRIEQLEQELVKANHRNLDLQYMLDSSEDRRNEIAEKLLSLTHIVICPSCDCIIELPDINTLKKDVARFDIPVMSTEVDYA